MPAGPRSGMSYKGEKNATEALRRARKGGGPAAGAATEEELSPIELQEMHGNEYLNELMKGGQTGQAQQSAAKGVSLPPEVRFRMLASNDIQILASLIYSQCTPSETVTREMLAVGSVYFNRWEETLARPEAQKEFGAANFQGLLFDVQKKMPLYYKPERLSSFHGAARFGGELPSQLDMKTACAAIKAAEQIYTGVNPFPDRYMYMDISAASTQPDKVDASSHIQYGKLHFWAAKTGTAAEDQAVQDAQSPLAATAAEPLV